MELGNASSNVMGYNREYPCLYRGVVEKNIDPENLGRCKIRVPSVHGSLDYSVDMLPWARPLVLSPVKSGRGSVNLPDKGDIVWVFFEGANKEFPIYLGGTYAKGEIDVSNDRVDFYIEKEDRFSYDRKKRRYDITVGPNAHVKVYPDTVQLILDPDAYITMTPGEIDLKVQDKEILIDSRGINIYGDTFIRKGHLHVNGDIISKRDIFGLNLADDNLELRGLTSLCTHYHIVTPPPLPHETSFPTTCKEDYPNYYIDNGEV